MEANPFEEYVRTHGDALLNALTLCKIAARNSDRDADVTYWQHETNALVGVIRQVSGQLVRLPE